MKSNNALAIPIQAHAESTDEESEYHEVYEALDHTNTEHDAGDLSSSSSSSINSRTKPNGDNPNPISSPASPIPRRSETEPRSSSTFPVGFKPSESLEIAREQSNDENLKSQKKAVSFLSRFLSSTSKKRTNSLPLPNELSITEDEIRAAAMEENLFAQDVDNIEFSPRILQPSAYIKVKHKNKRSREFDRLFRAQELKWTDESLRPSKSRSSSKPEKSDQDAIWAMAFSLDGRYLAAGGNDGLIKIWSVLSTEEEREIAEELHRTDSDNTFVQMDASVFQPNSIRTYADHDGSILDIQWSKNNFIITTSQDRTVRLYHPSREECLCTFKHGAPVLVVAFHPKDDRFFLAGCKDGKLRLWSIPDKRVEYWATVGDMITAVAFSPDGKTCLAGTVNGAIHSYNTETLKSQGQIPVRSKRKNRITGLQIKAIPFGSDSYRLLVTTTDSRVRLYNLRDKSLELKLKAHKNDELSIRASINDDCRYVICPSEDKDKGVYIWSVADTNLLPMSDRERDKTIQRPLEYFEANTSSKTTCALLAPVETRILLGKSADPIYDICNPPPIRLVEREGSIASSSKHHESNASIHSHNLDSKIQHGHTSSQSPNLGPGMTPQTVHSATFPLDNSSVRSTFHSRALHETGPIIVTASSSGNIRIFRQDCAFGKRKNISSAAASLRAGRAYLKRALASHRNSLSGPPSGSNTPHPNTDARRPSSIYSTVSPFTGASAPSGPTKAHTGDFTVRSKAAESGSSQPTRDRIERWRADIDGRGSPSISRTNSISNVPRTGSASSNKSATTAATTAYTHQSPAKSSDVRASLAAARGSPAKGNLSKSRERSGSEGSHKTGPPQAAPTSMPKVVEGKAKLQPRNETPKDSEDKPTKPEAKRGSSFMNPLRLQGGQSFMFWNMSQHDSSAATPDSSSGCNNNAKNPAATAHDGSTPLSKTKSCMSTVSQLTDELSDSGANEDADADADADARADVRKENEPKSVTCARCGGKDVRVKEGRSWAFGKTRTFVCHGCGLERRVEG